MEPFVFQHNNNVETFYYPLEVRADYTAPCRLANWIARFGRCSGRTSSLTDRSFRPMEAAPNLPFTAITPTSQSTWIVWRNTSSRVCSALATSLDFIGRDRANE